MPLFICVFFFLWAKKNILLFKSPEFGDGWGPRDEQDQNSGQLVEWKKIKASLTKSPKTPYVKLQYCFVFKMNKREIKVSYSFRIFIFKVRRLTPHLKSVLLWQCLSVMVSHWSNLGHVSISVNQCCPPVGRSLITPHSSRQRWSLHHPHHGALEQRKCGFAPRKSGVLLTEEGTRDIYYVQGTVSWEDMVVNKTDIFPALKKFTLVG